MSNKYCHSVFLATQILDALTIAVGVEDLDGFIEADETFFGYNRKGNFTKDRNYKKGALTTTEKTTKKVKKKSEDCPMSKSPLAQH